MEVDAPRTISATGGRYALTDNAEVPDTLEVTYEYEKAGQKFLMVWSQTDASEHGFENQGLGIMFQGTEGTLVADYGIIQDHPRARAQDRRAPQEPAALARPSPRVARRHQEPRPVLVPLRLRPSFGDRRQPGQHLALDRRKAGVGPGRRTDHEPHRSQSVPDQDIPRALDSSHRLTELDHDAIQSGPGLGRSVRLSRPRRGPTTRSGSSTRSTARANSRRPAFSMSTMTASSTSSRAQAGTRPPTGRLFPFARWRGSAPTTTISATLPLDVNGDGNTDFVTCSYFGQDVGWVENPGKPGAAWTYHEIDQPGNIEAAWMVDLSGDGVPDVLPNTVNVVVWYEVVKKADGKGVELKKHDFGKEAAGHGVGSGDVNGDGRTDLLTPKGWFEAPADPAHDAWAWHPEWQAGATGIQMLARDVDGDGLSDVVYGMGHDYGLFWFRQGKSASGERTWTKGTIDNSIASVHALMWADIDGDGKALELVTGKRVYAHEDRAG